MSLEAYSAFIKEIQYVQLISVKVRFYQQEETAS